MKLILEPVGEILHPKLANKWRISEWTAKNVEHDNIITFQAIALFLEQNYSWYKPNTVHIEFEEDVQAKSVKALDTLRKAGLSNIVLEYLDDNNTPLKIVKLNGVKIKKYNTKLDYAKSACVKANIECTVKSIEYIYLT